MAKAKRYTVICDICYSPVAKNVGIRAAERAATSHMNLYKHSVHIVPYTENPSRNMGVRVSRPKITARGRKRNAAPKGRALRETFTLSTLRAVRNGGRVEKIWYEDARDLQHYYHDFDGEQGAIMYLCESAAVGKCVLIVSGDLATPLWEDA